MKKALLALLIFSLAVSVRAEYQAYEYRASVRLVESSPKGGGKVVSCTFKGVLVTVCCYPCGADYGKGYQSWLFVSSSRVGRNVIWKIPCEVSGCLFGNGADPLLFSEERWAAPTPQDVKIGKAGNRSSFFMRFSSEGSFGILGRRLFGPRSSGGELTHVGIGSGAVKYNRRTNDPQAVWNPYVKTASGAVTGYCVVPSVGFQPSNRDPVDVVPAYGTFSVRFSQKVTELIRGNADWDVISLLVLSTMKYRELYFSEYDDSLMWSDFPLP